jgi:hypothetical protein
MNATVSSDKRPPRVPLARWTRPMSGIDLMHPVLLVRMADQPIQHGTGNGKIIVLSG